MLGDTIRTAGLVLVGASAVAQSDPDTSAAASATYFMLNNETGVGGASFSATYRLQASGGSGFVATSANSSTFRLAGGFLGSATVSGSGRPWLAGTLPRFVKLRSAARVALHGTELTLGGAPTVNVDGRAATLVGSPSKDEVEVQLPLLRRPGWRAVTLSTPAGTTTLPRGIGVLPMVYSDPAPARSRAFDLVFRGTQGDQVMWAIGVAPAAVPFPLGAFHHGLMIDPVFVLVMPGGVIANPNGEWRLPLPPTPGAVAIYVQGLFLSSDPAYAPGTFSNLLSIRQ